MEEVSSDLKPQETQEKNVGIALERLSIMELMLQKLGEGSLQESNQSRNQ